METNNIISKISGIQKKANELLINELKNRGLKGIAPSHGFILYVLFKSDGITMKDITNKINKKKNTVTVLIDKLVTQGFIKKVEDDKDRRTTRIYLSQKGRDLETHFNKISEILLERVYLGFTETEKNTLIQLLEKMNRNFE